MFDLILTTFFGSALGVFAGLVPGVGMLAGISILYPILLDWDPVQILLFYTSMACSAQYFGSVTAIYLGVAGEASSFPAVIEGYTLSKKGEGQKSIFLTGIGSFVGTMFGLFFVAMLSFSNLNVALTSFERMLLFFIIGISLIFTTKNRWYVDIFLIILALALCHIGADVLTAIPMTNFGLVFLASGISYFPLAAGLLCMKEIMDANQPHHQLLTTEKSYNKIFETIKHKWSILRGSLIGSIGGMLPGMTTISASHLAYTMEKIVHKKNYAKGNTHCLTSSETANNSGSITQLFPLLMFGLPITGSEAILYNILDTKGWQGSSTLPLKLFADNWWLLLSVNIFSLILAIRFAKYFVQLIPKDNKILTYILFCILGLVVYIVAQEQSGYPLFNLCLYFLGVFIAYCFPKTNFLVFIFWMVIGRVCLTNFYRFLQIYGLY